MGNPCHNSSTQADSHWHQQPKTNVNTAAIKVWKKSGIAVPRSSYSRPRRQRRRRRRPASVRDRTATDIGVQKISPQVRYISETSSRKSYSSSEQALNKASTSIDNQSPSFDNSNCPDVVVQVSQHSSLDRRLYTVYQSSLSSKEVSSSLPQDPDSGPGESSPEPHTSPPVATQGNTIIPDSQSLPGSSTYAPTSSSPAIIRATATADLSPSIISAVGNSYLSQVITSSNFESSDSLAVITANCSIQGSSKIEVAASQPSAGRSSGIVIAATQSSVADSSLCSTAAVSANSGDHHTKRGEKGSVSTTDESQTFQVTAQRRVTVLEPFEISEDHTDDSHPSQATTTDGSILSSRDPNSQTAHPVRLVEHEEDTNRDSSTTFIKPILPIDLDSWEPPQPPTISDDEMSDLPSYDGNLAGGLQSVEGTKEKLKRMREANAAKKGTSLHFQEQRLSTCSP